MCVTLAWSAANLRRSPRCWRAGRDASCSVRFGTAQCSSAFRRRVVFPVRVRAGHLPLRVFFVKNSAPRGILLLAASWHFGRVNGIIQINFGDQSRTGCPAEGNHEGTRRRTVGGSANPGTAHFIAPRLVCWSSLPPHPAARTPDARSARRAVGG